MFKSQFTVILVLIFSLISVNSKAQNNKQKTKTKLTVELQNLDNHIPMEGLVVELIRSDSLRANLISDATGCVTFSDSIHSFLEPLKHYMIKIHYPIYTPFIYKQEFATEIIKEFNTQSYQEEGTHYYKVFRIQEYHEKTTPPILTFRKKSNDLDEKSILNLEKIVKLSFEYPHWNLQLNYKPNNLSEPKSLYISRLEKVKSLLIQKGIPSTKIVLNSIKKEPTENSHSFVYISLVTL